MELREQSPFVWAAVTGLGDIDVLRAVADVFSLHRLALEDVVNTHQRAKLEEYPEHQFVVLRRYDSKRPADAEQVSVFLGDGYVLSFEEHAADGFAPVRARLRDGNSRLRSHGPDYLAYALVDAAVDSWFPALEALGDRMELVEDEVLAGEAQPSVVADLHAMRREMLAARRALWPLREVTASLVRGDSPRVSEDTRVYLRDVHDHVVQLVDLLENCRELGAGLMELHLATASMKLNEVMKVLTVIATVFIPLTFVVGIYGMNFDFMPELRWEHGYPAVMGGMLALALGMLLWFRRRGWL